MNQLNYEHLMIMDLEATCSDDLSIPKVEMEIIEIGAVMVKRSNFEILSEFQTLIKPVRHPRLTKFCTDLTTITQEDVDAAPDFASAIQQFSQWLSQFENYVFCSWGQFDRKQLDQDCLFHKIANPLQVEHFNIKYFFSVNQNLKKQYGMAKALRRAQIELEGTHHRGLDDAKNMVKLLPLFLEHDSQAKV